MNRSAIINAMMGAPYRLGAQGPDAFDCYSVARQLQRDLFGRDMPAFDMPGNAGRMAIAAAIAEHPERGHWAEIARPRDGALVTMARNGCGYHLGTWLAEDGGIVVHAIEGAGVCADTMLSLQTAGWRRLRFHVPT